MIVKDGKPLHDEDQGLYAPVRKLWALKNESCLNIEKCDSLSIYENFVLSY